MKRISRETIKELIRVYLASLPSEYSHTEFDKALVRIMHEWK